MTESTNIFYYAADQRIPLELVEDTLAVGFAQPISDRRLDELRASDRAIDILGQSPALLSKNILVYQLKSGVSSQARLDDFGQRLLRGASVQFVTYVFFSPTAGLYLVMGDEIVVRFKPETTPAEINALHARFGTETLEQKLYAPNQHLMRVNNPSFLGTLEVANRYHEQPLVEWAEPNFVMEPQLRLVPRQWHLNNTGQFLPGMTPGSVGEDVKAEAVWQITRGSGNVVIAVLDEGVDVDHPGLQPNIAPNGANFDDPNNPTDPRPVGDGAHGTCCSGVAAGNPTGGLISGMAPQCKILPIKMLAADNNRTADAVHYAALHAQVLSNSWGAPFSNTIEQAFNDVIANGRQGKGTIVLFAIGNDNAPVPVGDQSTITGVIGIAASTNVGSRAGYSNFGDDIDLPNPTPNARRKRISVAGPSAGVDSLRFQNFLVAGAPDNSTENIYTTDIRGQRGDNPPKGPWIDPVADPDYTGLFSGTSSSCPLVAGICALMLSVNADMTATRVKYIVEATADKIGTGAPRLDAPNQNVPASELAHYDPATGYDVFTGPGGRPLSRYGFGRANAEQAVRASLGAPLRQLTQDTAGADALEEAISVVLDRVPGTNRFVSRQVLELIDARRDPLAPEMRQRATDENKLFVRGGPGGFLRALYQPAGGGPSMTDEVEVLGGG